MTLDDINALRDGLHLESFAVSRLDFAEILSLAERALASPADRRLHVLARLKGIAERVESPDLQAFLATTRTEYADVFADVARFEEQSREAPDAE